MLFDYAANFRQFYLLLWKNFVLQIRRPIGTAFELVIPLLAVVLVIVLRHAVFNIEDKCFVTFEPDPIQLPYVTTVLFYAPNGTEENEIMRAVQRRLDTIELMPAASEDQMVNQLLAWRSANNNDSTNGNRVDSCINGYGIVFNIRGNHLQYTIRPTHEVDGFEGSSWDTRVAQPQFQQPGPRFNPNNYLSEGFLHLQNLVGMSIIERIYNTTTNTTEPFEDIPVNTKQFPYPPYEQNGFLLQINNIMPLLIVLSFIYSAGTLVKELVLEKETRLRESMKMMGLSQWILWLTWYLKQFLFLMITVLLMAILIRVQVFEESDFFLILIFLTLFINCLIAWGFLISVFFSKAVIGMLVGFLAWFCNFFPYFFLTNRYEELSTAEKVLSCFLSNTCMGLGINVIATLEIREEGVLWSNVADPLSADDDFNLAIVFTMLIIDSIIYMLIAWYVDAVFPGDYGIPKPFYFFVLPSYWCGRRGTKVDPAITIELGDMNPNSDKTAHEPEPKESEIGISIRGLSKVFKGAHTAKVAVDNLHLNMYQDQITVLLGHNGAGKTTTMSMLVGLFPPSSGDAIINGYSILTDMENVRQSLGLCPQHNVLYDRLTVREHLNFFARLKGMTEGVKEEVNSMIDDLQLTDKANQKSAALSGGQKRKLSVGVALVANSKFVILDEPTSGMDPYARRATWDLLSKHKKGRTILLTTHYMDEADLLGDRIAIMAEGQLRCSGSSLFLKSRYGVGYHMVVTKEAKCDTSTIIDIVTSTIAGSEMVTDVGAELSFILPNSGSGQFPALFEKLEAHKTEYGISGFGVSVTTMEEVFIKVGEGFDETLEGRLERQSSTTAPAAVLQEGEKSPTVVTSSMIEGDVDLPGAVTTDTMTHQSEASSPNLDDSHQIANDTQYELNNGYVLWIQQFYALLVKRFLHSIRNWRAIIIQVVLPVIFILLGLILIETIPGVRDADELRMMSLPESAFIEDDIITFFAEFGNGPPIFENTGALRRGIGATQLNDVTDRLQRMSDNIAQRNITDREQCCSYPYQVLDTFCATQVNLREVCQDRGTSYSNCLECYSCANSATPANHLATCTYPSTRDNELNSNDDFCPYPPSVRYTEDAITNGEPLDHMSYYMDEYLMRLSESDEVDSTVDFFRKYMAGFLISTHETSTSVCGSDYVRDMDDELSADTGDLICTMFGTTPVAREQDYFRDTVYRTNTTVNNIATNCAISGRPSYQAVVGCTVGNLIDEYPTVTGSQYPECTNVTFQNEINRFNNSVNTLRFVTENVATNISQDVEGVFQVDGAIREVASANAQPSGSNATLGRRYAGFGNSEIRGATVYYNNQPFHMPAAALNAFHTIYLRYLLRNANVSNPDSYSMSVNNHPLPRSASGEVDAAEDDFLGFSLSIIVIFGLSFLAASFILYPVAEKASKAKHIQFVSGVHITSFWISAFLWDLLNSFVPIILGLILFAAFPNDSYRENIGAVFLLLFLFCWCSIPLVYTLSFFFNNALIAFALTILLFFFSALFCLIIVLVVDQEVGEVLNYMFLVLPSYAFSQGLGIIHTNYGLREVCQQEPLACEEMDVLYAENELDFRFPGIGANLFTMAIEGFLFFALTLLLEQEFFIHKIAPLLKERVEEPLEISPQDDSDVADEKTRLNSRQQLDDIIQLKNIKKKYAGHLEGIKWFPPKYAVRGLSLGVPKGECFGLLGVNGAGKTTTFSMLTGDIRPSNGTATIAGYDITTDIREVQRRIGYCPQFDALIDDMTSYELLRMYSRLRGIPEDKIQGVVETEITRLDLTKHASRLCGTYSGGNKRKLSTAIALVGNPLIVFLDEPTSGMDPATRRNLWNALISVIKTGKSIVLTSHSMEECEALCTRLAIMVNGEFKCLGGIQHLKNKFGKGFTLQVKIGSPDDFIGAVSEPIQLRGRQGSRFGRQTSKSSEPPASPMSPKSPMSFELSAHTNDPDSPVNKFHKFIKETFESSTLIEEHQGAIAYQLEGHNVTWSYIFRKLEENKSHLLIVDYSVSQTTLEQVFLNFAKNQVFEEQ